MMFETVRHFEDYKLGEKRKTTGRTITEADIVLHAGHVGDYFPHHVDAEWAAKSPFHQRIAHGTLIFAVGAGMTAGEINSEAFSYGYDRLRFVAPVFIGDTITVDLEISGKRDDPKRAGRGFVDETCRVTNQRGETVMIFTHIHSVNRRSPN